jgi:hypothetical protein
MPKASPNRIVKKESHEVASDERDMRKTGIKKEKVQVEHLSNGKVIKKRPVQVHGNSEGENPERRVVKPSSDNTKINSQSKIVKPERKVIKTPENKRKETVQMDQGLDDLDDFELPDLELPDEMLENDTMVNQLPNEEIIQDNEQSKKRRGRPRKNPVELENKPKGKRGRPRKIDMDEIESDDELPDLETITTDQLELDLDENEEMLSGFDDELENNDFEELMVDDDDESDDFDDEDSEEIELPELDDLDDINEFEDDEDDEFSKMTEESFDEFDDYDEYGEYETTANSEDEELEDFDDEDFDNEEFDDAEADDSIDFDNEIDELEDDSENDDILLSDLEEDDDLLSAIEDDDNDLSEVDEDANSFGQEDDSMNDIFEEDYGQNAYTSENSTYTTDALESLESPIDYSMSNLNSLMTKDKKIVTFLGSTKNGVSFLVNNLAEIFASIGINTAILDMTKNRNSYYIYTQNEESLRQIAYSSLEKLQNGVAEGIRVKQNLTVYTALPNDGKNYPKVEEILSTLVQNHSLILIDCDFDTNPAYFASCQEIYLVQSMDILTIQPLTAFLKDLKTQGVFEPEKVRVVINKELKVKGLTSKAIIGGMSSYNDPAMSFMSELFNKDIVKYCCIPFEEMVYSKYLEAMLNCKISINGYSKNFMNKLRILGDMVYPLTSRQTYSTNSKQGYKPNNFSNSMNDTLNKMKKKY